MMAAVLIAMSKIGSLAYVLIVVEVSACGNSPSRSVPVFSELRILMSTKRR